MAKRLHTQFSDFLDNSTYQIELHDENWEGSSTEIGLNTDGGDGVVHTWEGSDLDVMQWIVPSTLTMELIISEQAHQDYVDTLKLADEGQFWVKMSKGNLIDFNGNPQFIKGREEFIGLITIDESYIDAVPLASKRMMQIRAMDGLSYLKSRDYIAAQSQVYIDQASIGKFRVRPNDSQSWLLAAATKSPWKIADQDQVSNFNIANSAYNRVGRYDFNAYVSVVGDISEYQAANGVTTDFLIAMTNSGFQLYFKLYKIDVNDDTIELATEVMSFIMVDQDSRVYTNRRLTASIQVQDIEILEGEDVYCQLEWDNGDAYIRYTVEESSYYENVIDAPISIQNIYASFKDHFFNIMQQLPTYQYYSSTAEMFGINIPEEEASQSTAKGEDYIGLPYNGFVNDYSSAPPRVVSCWEALEYLCKQVPGQLRYIQGMYQIVPYHEADVLNVYDKSMTFESTDTKTWSEADPMTCLGTGQYTYLPPIRHVELCYSRLSSLNLLNKVASQFPTSVADALVTTDEAILYDRVYRLRAVIRVGALDISTALQGIADSNKYFRHNYKIVLKLGTKYAKVINLNTFKTAEPVYSGPVYEDSSSYIDALGPLQKNGIKEHAIDVQYDLPAYAYTGPIQISIEYDQTFVRQSSTEFTSVDVSPLQWSLDTLRLSTIDEADNDKIYSDTICTKVYTDDNSTTYELDTEFSDLWTMEDDPGAIKVWDGSEWVTPGLWNGRSYQAAMTQWIANRLVKPAEIINHAYRVEDYYQGHIIIGTDKYLMIKGDYSYTYNRLSGQWIKYETADIYNRLNTNTYIKAAGSQSSSSQSLNNAQSSGGSSGGDTATGSASPANEEYIYFADDLDTDIIQLPNTYRLPNPSDYTQVELINMFSGSLRGSGNYVYNAALTRPEHLKIHDYTNLQIKVGRALTSGQSVFLKWVIPAN